MGDMGDVFRAMTAHKKQKRKDNTDSSVKILEESGVEYQRLSPSHYRVGDYDFWPSTGLYIKRKNGKRSRGVFNLLRAIQK